MPAIEDLQKMKAALDAQIAQALVQEAILKKEQELARIKAREAEIATGLQEIAGLMRQYRLSKEHLFKAAQSSPAQAAGTGHGEMLNGLTSGEVRDDVRFEFERANSSNQQARPMSVEEMRQFYEKFDAVAPISP
jgi:hypothetical protein